MLGYEPGKADGVIGSRTRSAIRRFQKVWPLPVTGQLEKRTADALAQAIASLPGDRQIQNTPIRRKPRDSGQSIQDIAAGEWLNSAAIKNLLHDNTAYMTFRPAGNTSTVFFDKNEKVYARTKDFKSIYVANWKVRNDLWCMETKGPTVCYKVKVQGDVIQGWHLEGNKPIHSVDFHILGGDSSNLVYENIQNTKSNTHFVDAAKVLQYLVAGATLHAMISGSGGGNSSGQAGGSCANGTGRLTDSGVCIPAYDR